MSDLEDLAGAILGQIDVDRGVKEFKRTHQRDDGTTLTFRVDVLDVKATEFTAAGVRQPSDGGRVEIPAKTFARTDRAGFARWIEGDAAEAGKRKPKT